MELWLKLELWHRTVILTGGLLLAVYAAYSVFKAKYSDNAGNINAKLEFATNAKAFSGLYEPLHKIAHGIGKYRVGVIGDWAVRTENLQNAQSYIEYWKANFGSFSDWTQEEGVKKSASLLSFVREAGIYRSAKTDIIVDGDTYKFYEYADEMIEEGSAASIINPYWIYGDTVLEKGIIKKMEGDTDNG